MAGLHQGVSLSKHRQTTFFNLLHNLFLHFTVGVRRLVLDINQILLLLLLSSTGAQEETSCIVLCQAQSS